MQVLGRVRWSFQNSPKLGQELRAPPRDGSGCELASARPSGSPAGVTGRALSSLCRGMFAGGLKEMGQEEVLIHGVSYSAMRQILHFIYTAELELSLSNVQETLVAACQLQVRLRPEGAALPSPPLPSSVLGFTRWASALPGVTLPSARPTGSCLLVLLVACPRVLALPGAPGTPAWARRPALPTDPRDHSLLLRLPHALGGRGQHPRRLPAGRAL